jgi:hypothetical protein
VRQTTLDDRGGYAFYGLPAGTYRVQLPLNVGQLVPVQGNGIIHLGSGGRAYLPLKMVRPQGRGTQAAPEEENESQEEESLSPDETWRWDAVELSPVVYLSDGPADTTRDQVFACWSGTQEEETRLQRDPAPEVTAAMAQPEEVWSQAAQALLVASLATFGLHPKRHNSWRERGRWDCRTELNRNALPFE